MKTLYVLFDGTCEFCIRCRRWLDRQPKFIDLVFIPAGSGMVKRRFPDLRDLDKVEQLVVISDAGGVYRGARAWVMCLYALREYREWSATLAGAAMMPLARRAFEFFSRNRHWISGWLTPSEDSVLEQIRTSRGAEFIWGEEKSRPEAQRSSRLWEGDVTIFTDPEFPKKGPLKRFSKAVRDADK